jgi:protein TonB
MRVETLHVPPIDVRVLPIPPQPPQNIDRTEPPNVTTQTEPAPPVMIDPVPIYRGGLVFPDRAMENGKSGFVDFTFVIEPDGSVGDPTVVGETPTGYGFAAAALKAFHTWRFKPKLVDGRPVAAPARIRVSFQLK